MITKVLILIVVDYGLVLFWSSTIIGRWFVLILVVVEDGLVLYLFLYKGTQIFIVS